MEIRGRFLPSRVYSRWKWTVRFGLLLVTFLVFLTGGLILYLTPSQYRSAVLFSMENSPPPPELVELAASRGVLEHVVTSLELVKRFGVDPETAMEIVREATDIEIVPDTGFIHLAVTMVNKVDARDVAEKTPEALGEYLLGLTQSRNAGKAAEFDRLIRAASDTADEKAAVLANLEKVHGLNPADETAMIPLQRARRASLLADAEVERLRVLRADCLAENLGALPRLIVHSAPTVSNTAIKPEIGDELNLLAGRSLVTGLLSALLLPYLLELAFPPRRPRFSEADSTDGL